MHCREGMCFCKDDSPRMKNFYTMKQTMKRYRGITLMEVLVGLFVFTTVVVATSALFASSFKAKRSTQDTQKRYDAAFATLGEVGKIISTSTIMESTNSSGNQSLVIYSYSIEASQCIQFTFDSSTKKLVMKKRAVPSTTPYTDCRNTYLTDPSTEQVTVIDQFITGRFMWRELLTRQSDSNNNKSGMVTIFAQVYTKDPSSNPTAPFIPIQTTVSLRDYLVD